MKKILVTGTNSYIGTSLENWLMREPEEYRVDTVDMIDGSWKEKDFSSYDVVFHVAGIVHIKETSANQDLYYKVNRDLAFETARKAKGEGVGQFIFLSSMSVYRIETGVINKDTPLNPNTAYGKSKLEAEGLIKKLGDESFVITIIRPPMVYGKGCKGNYQLLSKWINIFPLFPDINNQRSMIHIEKLCEYIRNVIDRGESGLYLPQDDHFISTTELARQIAAENGKHLFVTKIFNWVILLGKHLNIKIINKVFGDLIYEREDG